MQIQPILGYFWAILGLYQPPGPPFGSRPPLFTYPGSAPAYWVIISRRWERNQKRDSEWPINTDSPRKKKCCTRFQAAKSQASKTPRTDTILPKRLLAHTLITYVYSHYCIWSFCHRPFPCKNDVLITSMRIEFSNHENKQSLTQTFYLLLAAALSM